MHHLYCGGVSCQYSPDDPSNIFKLNQLGNGANQKKKFAYMGAWLGSAGTLPLQHLDGKIFELRRSKDGACVYKNNLKFRGKDPEYQKYVKSVPIMVPFIPLYSVEKYKFLVA